MLCWGMYKLRIPRQRMFKFTFADISQLTGVREDTLSKRARRWEYDLTDLGQLYEFIRRCQSLPPRSG